MEPRTPPSREVGEGYRHLSYGLTFGGGIILFVGIGFWLDRRLGLTPVLTLVGTVLGAVLSFLNVFWKLRAEEQARRSGRRR